MRDKGLKVHGVGKISDIFAGCDIDESRPTKSNVDGINQTVALLQEIDDGLVFTNLVETDMLWGHRNDPLNFHRCLQDFDRRLEDILEALRPGDLLVLTSDHGCDPTTPSTDHSREHALLLAYAAGRNANGATHEGEFADVGATVNAWLGGKAPVARDPGHADPHAVKVDDPVAVRRQYATEANLEARRALYGNADGPDPREVAFVARSRRSRRPRVLEVGGGPGELAERLAGELGCAVVMVDVSERMVELARGAGRRRPRRGRSRAAVRRWLVRLRCRGVDALPRPGCRSRSRRARAGAPAGRTPRRCHERDAPLP